MNVDLLDFPRCRESLEYAEKFAFRFLRYRPLLYSLANRVLSDSQAAASAVENCWETASRNPQEFDYEGAFRSWLARVLMDEVLAILRTDRKSSRVDSPLKVVHSRCTMACK